MLGLLLAMQMTPPGDGLQSTMEPVSAQEAVGLFQKVCFDPFPDPQASQAAIADPALGLEKMVETPSQAMQPGDTWTSARAKVGYVDADWMPRDLGSPQCSVVVALDGKAVHGDVANAFAAKLGLPEGKIGKNGPHATSRWDVAGRDPDSWRIFLSTQQTFSGTELRMTMMNLRGKKKK